MDSDDIIVIGLMVLGLFATYKMAKIIIRLVRRYGVLACLIGAAIIAGAVFGVSWVFSKYFETVLSAVFCIFLLYAFTRKRTREEIEEEIEERKRKEEEEQRQVPSYYHIFDEYKDD